MLHQQIAQWVDVRVRFNIRMQDFQYPRLAQWYIAALTLAALSLLGVLLPTTQPLGPQAGLAFMLVGLCVLSILVPIPFAEDRELHLDTSVLVAAVLLFEPVHAMLIVGISSLLAFSIRRRGWARILFNTALPMIEAGIGGLILQWGGWSIDPLYFGHPHMLALIVVTAFLADNINCAGLAILFALRSGQSPLVEYWQSLQDEGWIGRLMWLAQVAIGLLAAIVAGMYPWAIALLVLPAAAVQYALTHQVRLRLQVEHALQASEANLAAAQRIAHLGSWEHDPRSAAMRWSDETYRLLGCAPRAFAPTSAAFLAAVHPDDRARVAQARAATTQRYLIEYRVVRADGIERILQEQAEIVVVDGKQRVVGTVYDITDRHALETRLAYQAFHDPLTGLPNRAFFSERVADAVQRATQHQETVTLLFLDLDGFKAVNDRWGHDAGDRLLLIVSERLQACVRAGDVVARLGGDEFTVLLGNNMRLAEVEQIAERIATALCSDIRLDDHTLSVTSSIGIVRSTGGEHTPTNLLRFADAAMYRAKRTGKARVAMFDPAIDRAVIGHHTSTLEKPRTNDHHAPKR